MKGNKERHTNNLKQYRIEADYTQKEVCKLIRLASENRLSEWENGTSTPNITNLFKLAYLYKVEPQKLYSETYTELRENIKKTKRELYPSIIVPPPKHEYDPPPVQLESKKEAVDYLAKLLVEIFFDLKRNGKL